MREVGDAVDPRCGGVTARIVAHDLDQAYRDVGRDAGRRDGVTLHVDEVGVLRESVAHRATSNEAITGGQHKAVADHDRGAEVLTSDVVQTSVVEVVLADSADLVDALKAGAERAGGADIDDRRRALTREQGGYGDRRVHFPRAGDEHRELESVVERLLVHRDDKQGAVSADGPSQFHEPHFGTMCS
ncbi:unannotated protein [freshwater metagenome]|uniref:Unannotated protein n=1 Tax=freshwater metagenome TaxID=449393 RepID=A0A6J7CAD3_9ZZZZ